MATKEFVKVLHITESASHEENIELTMELIAEQPLMIRVEGAPYSVVMRTPGEEIFHAAGFCLTEGLIDAANDLASIGFCDEIDSNTVDVRLTPERRERVAPITSRRSFISQTSCGICGKELIEDLFQEVVAVQNKTRTNIHDLLGCFEALSTRQVLNKNTRAAHAAIIVDNELGVCAFAEDVGRHNALDKAIGKMLMAGQLGHAQIAALTSRISYELVQKAARAGVPIILGMSMPTALAVELAQRLNITVACKRKDQGLMVFCGQHRLG